MTKQKFGYCIAGYHVVGTKLEVSKLHSNILILREFAQSRESVFPVGENHTEFAQRRAIANLFRIAYHEFHGRSSNAENIRRIKHDLREFLFNGRIPYYLMRLWYSDDQGETMVQEEIALATTGPPSV